MEKKTYYISIKFETTNKAYTFATDIEELKCGDHVVVETEYGMELAEAVSNLREESFLADESNLKEIIRIATAEDLKCYRDNKADAEEAKLRCQKEADNLALAMKVIRAEYTLDRAKLTFIYVADGRVDFRALLKILASAFHCRIELRQVGARDKAKMISGIGTCGRELCCSRFKSDFDMVSINMAKNQLLALNVQKLSGQCGKLMCCLKYEDENYRELRKGLPKLNSQVEYEGAKYRITGMNVLTENCKLENKENILYLSFADLMKKGIFKTANRNPKKKEEKHDSAEKL